LNVEVHADDALLEEFARHYLELFSYKWTGDSRQVTVYLRRTRDANRANGSYLQCGQMYVDRTGDSYVASTRFGIVARGSGAGRWTVAVPEAIDLGEPQLGNLEDVFSLVCSVEWRAQGWIPVHAAAAIGAAGCTLLCAPSGGGKSTLTAALLLAGWASLGDDKLLLRAGSDGATVRPLLRTMNLDPQTQQWFPIRGIDTLPRYSAWTDKRRVHMSALTNRATPAQARPRALVVLRRVPELRGLRAAPIPRAETLPALLRQIVLPRNAAHARETLRAAAACASGIERAIHLEVGDGAYADPHWLAALEAALA
jgi:hypothetical protein